MFIDHNHFIKTSDLSYNFAVFSYRFQKLVPISTVSGLKNRQSFGKPRGFFTRLYRHLLGNLSLCVLSFDTYQPTNGKSEFRLWFREKTNVRPILGRWTSNVRQRALMSRFYLVVVDNEISCNPLECIEPDLVTFWSTRWRGDPPFLWRNISKQDFKYLFNLQFRNIRQSRSKCTIFRYFILLKGKRRERSKF